jgi:hypothetical protein
VAEPVTPTPMRVAFEARDHEALVEALSPDVVLRSPIFEVPFSGRDEVGDLFAVLLDTLWPLTYVDEIPGDPHVLHFTGEVGGKRLEGLDLIHLDEEGRAKEITVFFRPFPAVAAFLSETGPKLARRRGGSGRAAFLRIAGAPLSALMRTTATTGPRLLGLRRGEGS